MESLTLPRRHRQRKANPPVLSGDRSIGKDHRQQAQVRFRLRVSSSEDPETLSANVRQQTTMKNENPLGLKRKVRTININLYFTKLNFTNDNENVQ